MEYWQREIIMKNLPRLSMNTNVSTVFLAIFVSKNILSRADIELLNAQVYKPFISCFWETRQNLTHLIISYRQELKEKHTRFTEFFRQGKTALKSYLRLFVKLTSQVHIAYWLKHRTSTKKHYRMKDRVTKNQNI